MPELANRLLTLTAQIATAYVGVNAVDATAVPGLTPAWIGSRDGQVHHLTE